MGRTEQTVSRLEIPAGNWTAHQLRLVYDDTKDMFTSRLSQRDGAKFRSQYSLQFIPRSTRPNSLDSGCSTSRLIPNDRNTIMSSMRRGKRLNRSYGTIKEAICPEDTQSNDFRDWNIPTRLIQEKLNREENLPTGNEIRDLSTSLGKVQVELDSCQSGSGDALPQSPIRSGRHSRDQQVSSQSDKKHTNHMTWKLPVVTNSSDKVQVRPHTQPALKKFPPVPPRHTTTPDVKNSITNVEKHSTNKDKEVVSEIPETKTTKIKETNDQKKVDDAMRVAELHYKIDCALKKALFPDIYHTVKQRLVNLPTVEQEMILKFFKKKAEAITEVRRPEKLKQLLNFLMRGKPFGMKKNIKENNLNNLISMKLLSPRKRERRFELTTWHHRPIHKPTAKCLDNKTSMFLNARHMVPAHTF